MSPAAKEGRVNRQRSEAPASTAHTSVAWISKPVWTLLSLPPQQLIHPVKHKLLFLFFPSILSLDLGDGLMDEGEIILDQSLNPG